MIKLTNTLYVNMAKLLSSDVVDFLNAEFGSDVSKLKNIHEVLERLSKYENDFERQICPDKKDCSNVSFTRSAETLLENVKKQKNSHEQLLLSAKAELEEMSSNRSTLSQQINYVKELENLLFYLKWILKIEDMNSQMEETLKSDDTTQIVDIFMNLKDIWNHLKASECKNLVNYVQKTMLYWYNVLKDRFEKDFQKILTSLHWPVLTTNISVPLNQQQEVINKFNQLFLILYKLQLPDEYLNLISEKDTPSPILLPLQSMLLPLQKRFVFHFMGKKLTNRLDKPEWYLTQILSWISDHTPFIDKWVQPFLDQENLQHINARAELMRGLVQISITRFKSDLPSLMDNDGLLSHAIDEVLIFAHELHNQGYPSSFPSILQQLTVDPCFTRWKSLEHQSALEKMDRFLNSDVAWKSRYQDEGDLDDLRVPESAELFIILLLAMTERYSLLDSTDCQVVFMELQLELLDDFRLRLHQLSQCQTIQETIQANYCGILNAIHYIATILEEWNNSPFFLQLYTYVKKKNTIQDLLKANDVQQLQLAQRKAMQRGGGDQGGDVVGSVFDETIGLFEHMQKDLLQALSEHVMLDIKAKSRAYRKEKWFCMAVQDKKSMEVSTAALPLLEITNSSLHSLQELLAKPLFTNVWQKVAMELNIFLYEEVILQSSFSEGGAAQLTLDMTRNLFPIFGSYSLRPDNYFKLVKESCILLSLSSAPAMLLKETLKHEAESYGSKSGALEELGVHVLTPSQALIILARRSDTNL